MAENSRLTDQLPGPPLEPLTDLILDSSVSSSARYIFAVLIPLSVCSRIRSCALTLPPSPPIVDDKVQDVTVKKLTRKNPTMAAKFAEIRNHPDTLGE